MITAEEARKLTDNILYPVSTSPEFKKIMQRLDREIHHAIADGRETLMIKGYCLPVYNNYKYPKGINYKAIDRDTFWVPYVKKELDRNGFKVRDTFTVNTYMICW